MNSERLLKLADVIEEHEDSFNMWTVVGGEGQDIFDREYNSPGDPRGVRIRRAFSQVQIGPHCGTTACIGGWADSLWPAEIEDDDNWLEAAARILDMDKHLANWLMCSAPMMLKTAPQVASILRDLAAGTLPDGYMPPSDATRYR